MKHTKLFKLCKLSFVLLNTLRNKFKDDKDKLKALEDINSYIEEMEKIYQKAS